MNAFQSHERRLDEIQKEHDEMQALKDWQDLEETNPMKTQTAPLSSKEHSTLAGLRSRLDEIIEAAEKSRAFLDNRKQWRIVASLIDDICNESETAAQQINELL